MGAELDAALARLQASLGQLEAALGRHLDIDRRTSDLETELQIMGDDRARLAVELESAAARLAHVESAADHVGRRLGGAIGALREALASADGVDGRERG
jgi:chromosome segregation ATPase